MDGCVPVNFEEVDVRSQLLEVALLSYAFGTGVLAVAINLVTNLGGS
jgi:uncharacterized membrane protein